MMKKNIWVILFLAAFGVNIAGIGLGNNMMQYFSKPLLLLLLSGWLIAATSLNASKEKIQLLTGLLFCWAGDVLLLFEKTQPAFFMAGLCFFLMAHLFFISACRKILSRNHFDIVWWTIIPVMAYYVFIYFFLKDYLGDLKWPVLIYAAVISLLLFIATQFFFFKKTSLLFVLLGVKLFVISDTLLAINKFYANFSSANLLIVLTYGLAQFFIVLGAIKYLTTTTSSSQELSEANEQVSN